MTTDLRLPRGCRRGLRMLGTPKVCFRTREEAEAHINGGPGMNAYHCSHCGNYHVGHDRGTKFGTRPITSKSQIRRALRRARSES